MRKEGAANKGMLILVALIIVAVVAAVIMLQRGKVEPPPAPPAPAPAPEPAPPATPIVEPPEPAPAPVEEPAAAVEEPPAPEQPAEVAPAEPPKEPLNARTLAGTKWKPSFPTENQSMTQNTKVEVEFAPDGTWRINDQVKAKWAVEGKRVKIFDDKGEVHYLDIVGDKLMFNGEEIQRAN